MNEYGVFLPDSPHKIIRNHQINEVPWIVGVVEEEGLVDAASILLNKTLTAEINQDWHRIAPLSFDFRSTALEPDAVSNQIRTFYFGSQEIGNQTQKSLTNLYSDRYFCHCSRSAALLHKKRNEGMHIFLYYFTHRSATSHLNLVGIHDQLGVAEGDELQYLFKMKHFKASEIKGTSKYVDFSRKFVKLWLSFANTGTPSAIWGSEWAEIQSDEVKGDVALKYYRIDKNTSMIEDPFSSRMNFWDNLPLNEHEDDALLSVYSRTDHEE
jgi:carboxylesterase type B